MKDGNESDLEQKILSICGTLDPIALKLSAGDVTRYHQEGVVLGQTVGLHTWRVLVLLLHFWPNCSHELIVATIFHDVGERFTGDMPATVKKSHPAFTTMLRELEAKFLAFLKIPNDQDLMPTDLARLKCCDYIELIITCKFQTGRRAQQIYKRGLELLHDHMVKLPTHDQVRLEAFVESIILDKWQA